MKHLLLLALILTTTLTFAQRPQGNKKEPIKITGTVLDKDSNEPLEYATLVLQSVADPEKITGGITDESGKFNVEAAPGRYHMRIEYISYKTHQLPDQNLTSDTDLGTVKLTLDVAQLKGVEVVGQKTTVELHLDKKVYNVGTDMTVKGGSVTDVLDNVPSVTVDVEGNISLRGNESVRILINGKPSALSGLNPDALRQLPADAIEKVEVISNPSARYDAEGTAGIINIVLKQNKTVGLNGSLSVYAGHPDNYGAEVNLNLRNENFNLFTNTSYRYRNAPGNAKFEQQNYGPSGGIVSYQNEIRDYQRQQDGFNTNFGFEYFLSETSSITNSFVYRNSGGTNTIDVDFYNFDANYDPTIQRNRFTTEDEDEENVQYSLNYEKRFNDDGHKLTFDYQYSSGSDIENSLIEEMVLSEVNPLPSEAIYNDEGQKTQMVQSDYVLPFGKDSIKSQFELGYRGTFNNYDTDYVYSVEQPNGEFVNDPNITNELLYKEYINAAYTQLGTKIKRFSVLAGLRMEATNIDINLLTTNKNTHKSYVDWFPSLFLGYEINDNDQFTVSYSRRLRRPWSRFINPFPSLSSNTNIFQGNPDLDPTYTNAFDLGYLKRWDKVTFNTSAYFNQSSGVFLFVARETGDFVEIENPDDPDNPVLVPVIIRSPINLADENRLGAEFTTTYTPKTNWRLTWNLNLYQQSLRGDYTYTNYLDDEITQNFDSDYFSWFTRLSAKIPLPAKIDFQTNVFYRGRRIDAQNINKGALNTSLAFSKDILKEKATLSLNVSDLFNSRKRRTETRTENVYTYSEFQWRERQINLTFLYRFNQKKSQRGENNQREGGGGGEDMNFEG
ncbi:TonB-dependent receptor [Flavobacteriaceae bacterium F89]|uniref:TonB-dependent receptor n=1 Tax=Cerina litoralis TaxID=2874477 RepID=A0AAE3EVS6_9FLAO|nr:TonB-dependent receptor [Cerina litoralis]MCG2461888.1 TonB-dependent receptor [Cerina litoralis]